MKNADFKADGSILVPQGLGADLIRPESLFGGMWASVELDLLDSRGKLVERREQPCRSFLRNYGRIIRQMLRILDTTINDTVTDTGGTIRRLAVMDAETSAVNANEGPFSTTVGRLHFADSSAAVDSTQNNIQGTEFLTGVNVTPSTLIEDLVQHKYQYEGSILNNTGVPKTIREIVLTTFIRRGDAAGQNHEVAIMRDIVSPDVVVADGLTLVGRYKFTSAV
jgi:hypothetical protein